MSSTQIAEVRGRRVWDSRGNPTVEVEVRLASGTTGRAIAPSGASCGSSEAIELRDGGTAFAGKGVARALLNIDREIAPALRGLDAMEQSAIDDRLVALDGTANMRTLGSNATTSTSLAVLHAAAAALQMPLWSYVAKLTQCAPSIPLPEIQIFGGGAHAAGRIDVQDFMIMVPGAASFDEAMAVTAEVYRAAGRLMSERGSLAGVADEGGWWPSFTSNEEGFEILVRAIEKAGEVPGERVVISIDLAATQLRARGGYRMALDRAQLNTDQMIERLGSWLERYPIVAIEDPLAEDDGAGFVAFTRSFGSRVQVVGDDFLVTDHRRVRRAAADRACNTALIKVNQVGTVSGAVAALHQAQRSGWKAIVSARSGETEDVSISHLAVGCGAGQLKVGSFARSERMAKWNECLRIEEQLGTASFVGGEPLANTWWGQSASRASRHVQPQSSIQSSGDQT